MSLVQPVQGVRSIVWRSYAERSVGPAAVSSLPGVTLAAERGSVSEVGGLAKLDQSVDHGRQRYERRLSELGGVSDTSFEHGGGTW